MSVFRIEFDEQVWAQIINMLAELPYKQSGAIINTVAAQVQEQRTPEGSRVGGSNSGERAGVQ